MSRPQTSREMCSLSARLITSLTNQSEITLLNTRMRFGAARLLSWPASCSEHKTVQKQINIHVDTVMCPENRSRVYSEIYLNLQHTGVLTIWLSLSFLYFLSSLPSFSFLPFVSFLNLQLFPLLFYAFFTQS